MSNEEFINSSITKNNDILRSLYEYLKDCDISTTDQNLIDKSKKILEEMQKTILDIKKTLSQSEIDEVIKDSTEMKDILINNIYVQLTNNDSKNDPKS